jgi:hypothetical protein
MFKWYKHAQSNLRLIKDDRKDKRRKYNEAMNKMINGVFTPPKFILGS